MRFEPTAIAGVLIVDPEPIGDARGSFACLFDEREFAERGLNVRWRQHNLAANQKRGTLRGLHYQIPPHEEVKLVWCPHGAIFDVVLDLRPDSPTRGRWHGVELSAENGQALYIPAGLAHGYQTLVDGAAVAYQVSAHYHPPAARGVRFDDPAYGVVWPIADPILSERDRA